MGDAMAGGVGLERVDRVRHAEGVGQQGELPVVELIRALEKPFDVANVLDLLPQVVVELLDRALDDLELIDDEVGRVALVRLGQEVRAGVLSGGMAEDSRYRQVLDEPVAVSYTHLTLPTNREI